MKMKRAMISIVISTVLISGCGTIRLTTDYDEVIDRGIVEFTEQLNTHVKNMAELNGKPEGTYEENFKAYNALESKIDILINRASIASEGKACKLEEKVFRKISIALKDKVPETLQQGVDASTATANACDARLLELVKDQLNAIREIHKTTDTCGNPPVSCIRPATAKDALAIANQSANAVSVVEAAKKSQ